MERWGLVTQLEAELERTISLGLLPKDGKLPSERTLASKYGVSRTTAREALVRLKARGLVEMHPGRRARAAVMQDVVRLENLGTALLGEGASHPERQQLLAGYLELKREVTVELLAACCERASEEELERVRNACFLLSDAVCWELQRPRWLALEFELLRQAALVAQRPGHFLLIQSLEQACRGLAGRVEPYLDSAALYPWTQCALDALCSKDVKALRSRLPALLQASDERVLQALAPSCEAYGVASLIGAERQAPEVKAEAHPTPAQVPEGCELAEAHLTVSQVAESEPAEARLTVSQGPVASQLAEVPLTSTQAPEVGQPAPEHGRAGGLGTLCAMWSSCRTSLREVPPEGLRPCLLYWHLALLPAWMCSGRAPRRRIPGPGQLAGGCLSSPRQAGRSLCLPLLAAPQVSAVRQELPTLALRGIIHHRFGAAASALRARSSGAILRPSSTNGIGGGRMAGAVDMPRHASAPHRRHL